jgi:cell division septal protein FtsQ
MRKKDSKQPLPWRVIGRWGGILLVSGGLGSALFFLYTGFHRFLGSSYFEVKKIEWVGLHHRDAAEMNLAFQDLLGRNLFQVELTSLRRRLLSDPWIETGAVKKRFPDRLLFVVSERIPAAVAVDDPHRVALLGSNGEVIERGGNYPPDLPRLMRVHREALPLLPLAFTWAGLLADRQEAVLDLSDPRDLVIHLTPQWTLHVGHESEEDGADAAQQWRRFLEVEEDLLQGASLPLSIDLRFSEKVIVQAREVERI